MCGIVGYIGNRPASDILIDCIKRLEYRGYDSAGLSVNENGKIKTIKSVGKINDLINCMPGNPFGKNGITHTRWATHGGVTNENSHPHCDPTGKISIVHNGIIENYFEIKQRLMDAGNKFTSETDSEVIAHLISENFDGDLLATVRRVLPMLRGTYGLIVMHSDFPDLIIGARNGSPLVLGIGNDEMFLASDVIAFGPYVQKIVYLNDGEIIKIDQNDFSVTNVQRATIKKETQDLESDVADISKNGFEHFMLKEIYEQPESIKRGLAGRINFAEYTGKLGGLNMRDAELDAIKSVVIVASGTSYYAGSVGARMISDMARIPTSTEMASELIAKNIIVSPDTLYFVVSQSGETADTLFAMRELKRKGARVLGICNAVGSTIARESDGGVYIHSGPEIAVASTKAFTSQITAFAILALIMGRGRGMSIADGDRFIKYLAAIPNAVEQILELDKSICNIAKKYSSCKNFLFMGRGICHPVAMEGALKLKEISYIHAEAVAAGELKHGVIALVNPDTPSLFLVPDDELRGKNISSMKEVHARGGKIIVVTDIDDPEINAIADDVIIVPKTHRELTPFTFVVPLQLFAYHMANILGRDIDQPRNLAKSVTVE